MNGMTAYLVKRGLDRIVLIFTVLTIQFILLRIVPMYVMGIDPSRFLVKPGSPPHVREEIRNRFGLNEPIFPHQYFRYVLNLFTGQFGESFMTERHVYDEIMERLPNTVILFGSSLLVIFVIGLVVGIFAASRRGKRIDSIITQLSVFSYIMPTWLMGLVFLLALAWYPQVTWRIQLFPIGGTRTPLLGPDPWLNILDYLWHLSLPLASIVVAGFGSFAYYVRNLTITELGQDYVLTARAKGLDERTIMRKHVLRSVAPPLVTVVALSLPGVLSGGIITETVFSWHGLGLYVYNALIGFDYPAVQALLFMVAVVTAVSLYLCDVAIAYLDPRVRFR